MPSKPAIQLVAKASISHGDGWLQWYYLVQGPKKKGQNLRPESYMTWQAGSSVFFEEMGDQIRVAEWEEPDPDTSDIDYLDEIDFSYLALAVRGIDLVGNTLLGDIAYLKPPSESESKGKGPMVDPRAFHFSMINRLRIALMGADTKDVQLQTPLVNVPDGSLPVPRLWDKEETLCGFVAKSMMQNGDDFQVRFFEQKGQNYRWVDEAILLRDDDPRRKFAPLTFSHIAVNQGGSHILSHDLGDHIQVCLLNPYAGDDLVKRLALVKLKNLLLPGRSRFHEGEDSDAQGSDESDESSSDE